MREQIKAFFLDYFNNYLTVDKFAADNGLNRFEAITLIKMGRSFHEQDCEVQKHAG